MDMPAKLLTFGVFAVVLVASIGIAALTKWWVAPIALVIILLAIFAWVLSLSLGSR